MRTSGLAQMLSPVGYNQLKQGSISFRKRVFYFAGSPSKLLLKCQVYMGYNNKQQTRLIKGMLLNWKVPIVEGLL